MPDFQYHEPVLYKGNKYLYFSKSVFVDHSILLSKEEETKDMEECIGKHWSNYCIRAANKDIYRIKDLENNSAAADLLIKEDKYA